MPNDMRNALQKKFNQANRFANFGDVIARLHVRGFRCHVDTVVEIHSPITAFCGLNGTGKSTLLQLAATAYRTPDPEKARHFNISDFMVIGRLDPTPFRLDARLELQYWHEDRDTRTTSLTYNSASKRWRGLSNRRQRSVFFTGIGHYLPKIEQRDFIVRRAPHLTVDESHSVSNSVRTWSEQILSCSYRDIASNSVRYKDQAKTNQGIVLTANKNGIKYSESHMGFGEGRTMHLVSALEALPKRSLILIEEPETSLHPSAQHHLGRYLVDVALRKNHQIILTTHSMFLLTALPRESVVYLKRSNQGIEPRRNLSPLEIRSLLADGHVKALHVLVEDDCAGAILREIILRIDPEFLRVIDIQVGGDARRIAEAVRAFVNAKIPVACVRDGDQNPTPKENIFKLPGTEAPEKELFNHTAVCNCIHDSYGIVMSDFRVQLQGVNHHEWIDRLANHVGQQPQAILHEISQAFAKAVPEVEASALIDQLREVAHKA